MYSLDSPHPQNVFMEKSCGASNEYPQHIERNRTNIWDVSSDTVLDKIICKLLYAGFRFVINKIINNLCAVIQ